LEGILPCLASLGRLTAILGILSQPYVFSHLLQSAETITYGPQSIQAQAPTKPRVDYTKAEIEDFTGSIPLLLEKCIKGRKIDLRFDEFYDIIDKARGFVQVMRNGRECAWKQYVEHCSLSGT
jgi:hypothetical protein